MMVILALLIFNISFWLYIYIYSPTPKKKKKKGCHDTSQDCGHKISTPEFTTPSCFFGLSIWLQAIQCPKSP
jgi:hypothetical protein